MLYIFFVYGGRFTVDVLMPVRIIAAIAKDTHAKLFSAWRSCSLAPGKDGNMVSAGGATTAKP